MRHTVYPELSFFLKLCVSVVQTTAATLNDYLQIHISLAEQFDLGALLHVSPAMQSRYEQRFDVTESTHFWDTPVPDDCEVVQHGIVNQLDSLLAAIDMPHLRKSAISMVSDFDWHQGQPNDIHNWCR